jgi:hypothetical protein
LEYGDKVCEGSHSHALGPTTYISAPDRAEAETLRAGVAGEVSVHLELRPSLLRGGPPQGVDAWLIVKGANPVGAAAVRAEGVDRRVAPAAAVSPAAVVVAVVSPADLADLAVARAAGAAAAVAVPAAQAAGAVAVVRRAPAGPAAGSRVAAPPVAVVDRRAAAVGVVAGAGVVAVRAAGAVRKAVRAAAGAVSAGAVKAAVAETVNRLAKQAA